jgi:uncharacterized protein YuzE
MKLNTLSNRIVHLFWKGTASSRGENEASNSPKSNTQFANPIRATIKQMAESLHNAKPVREPHTKSGSKLTKDKMDKNASSSQRAVSAKKPSLKSVNASSAGVVEIELAGQYDAKVDALYVYFVPRPIKVYTTEPLSSDEYLALDYDRAGRLLGVELLFARTNLKHLKQLHEVLEPDLSAAIIALANSLVKGVHAQAA